MPPWSDLGDWAPPISNDISRVETVPQDWVLSAVILTQPGHHTFEYEEADYDSEDRAVGLSVGV